jgi:hypothetical protein
VTYDFESILKKVDLMPYDDIYEWDVKIDSPLPSQYANVIGVKFDEKEKIIWLRTD